MALPERCWALLLAAGESKRLGQPKQLLQLDGDSLVRRTARILTTICPGRTICVTGAHASAIEEALGTLPLQLVRNDRWERGMGASIAAGVGTLPRAADAVLLATCDQPRLREADYRALLEAATGGTCAAARYGEVIGIPAVLPRRLFPGLLALDGDRGARHLLTAEPSLEAVDLPAAAFDVDCPEDLEALYR